MKYGLNPSEVVRERDFGSDKILVAFKPEAKKADSRLFYMANPKIRCIMSVLESNIE